jgi:MYXO-CTERM domain-containing protein
VRPGTSAGDGAGLGALGLFGAVIAFARRRRRAKVVGLAALLLGLFGARRAQAQAVPAGGLALDRFHSAAAGSDWFAADSLSYEGHLQAAARVAVDYAHLPLVVYDASGAHRAEIVRDAPMVHAGASLTVYDRVRLGVIAPFSPYQGGEAGSYNGARVEAPSAGLGDLAFTADVRLAGAARGPASIALGARATTPTGSVSSLLGDGVVGVEPRATVAGAFGAFVYSVQGGVNLRPAVELASLRYGSELRFSTSAGVRLVGGRLLVGPELLTATPLEATQGHARSAVEVALGAHVVASREVKVGAAFGVGVVNAIGTPNERVLVSLDWTPGAPVAAPKLHEEVAANAPRPAPAPEPTPAPIPEPEPAPELVAHSRVLSQRVYFAFDRSDLSPAEEKALKVVVATVATNPTARIRVEGHTDSVGQAPYNEALSRARAQTVVAWLARHGVDRARLDLVGFGFAQPADPGTSATAHAANRRVEFRVDDAEPKSAASTR